MVPTTADLPHQGRVGLYSVRLQGVTLCPRAELAVGPSPPRKHVGLSGPSNFFHCGHPRLAPTYVEVRPTIEQNAARGATLPKKRVGEQELSRHFDEVCFWSGCGFCTVMHKGAVDCLMHGWSSQVIVTMHRLSSMPQDSIHLDTLVENIAGTQERPSYRMSCCDSNLAGGIVKPYSRLGMALPLLSSGIPGLNSLGFQADMEGSSARFWMVCICSREQFPQIRPSFAHTLHNFFGPIS